MSGEKIKNKGVVKYVGRVKEKRRTQRRHSSFYIDTSDISPAKLFG